ncbi:MAG TPA: hypothetical protein VFJ61_09920 [Solirubrobacterales bacterium]|nr:hypothetical protein [Solirubrobacterales bacterium]
MGPLAVILLAGAAGVAYLALVWFGTESKEIRFWAIWAVVGSILLCLAAAVATSCGIAENRSDLFNERCNGSVPYIPLYAIPPLLATPFLRRFVSGPAVLMVGAAILVVAIALPERLLSV